VAIPFSLLPSIIFARDPNRERGISSIIRTKRLIGRFNQRELIVTYQIAVGTLTQDEAGGTMSMFVDVSR
jgi:hypothetical protein